MALDACVGRRDGRLADCSGTIRKEELLPVRLGDGRKNASEERGGKTEPSGGGGGGGVTTVATGAPPEDGGTLIASRV